MIKNFRLLCLAFLLVIPSLLLTGCGKSKEIVVWNPFTGGDGEFFQQIVDMYNETNPEMKIRNTVVPDMYTRIYTVMNSNKDSDVPDLAVIHAERVPLFVSQGLLDSLDNMIEEQSNLNKDSFLPQTWDVGEVNGTRYAIPLDVHSSVMYYNEDLLNKYAPHALDDDVITFDEIKEIAEKASADGIITYTLNVEPWTVANLTVQNGGAINDGDTPTINTPEMKKSLETLKELVDIGATQEEGDEATQVFKSGQAVFIQDGTWFAPGLDEIEGLNWGVTHTPAYSPDKIVNWSSSHQFATLTKERSEEVEKGIGEFLEFVRENAMIWAESGQNAASVEVYEGGGYQQMPQSFLMADEKSRESMEIFDFVNNGITFESIGSVTRDIIFGRLEVDEGLEQAQRDVDDKVNEGR